MEIYVGIFCVSINISGTRKRLDSLLEFGEDGGPVWGDDVVLVPSSGRDLHWVECEADRMKSEAVRMNYTPFSVQKSAEILLKISPGAILIIAQYRGAVAAASRLFLQSRRSAALKQPAFFAVW